MASIRRLAAILAADVAGYSRLMGADEKERTSGSGRVAANSSTRRSASITAASRSCPYRSPASIASCISSRETGR
jgi:hypothetical protein